MGRTLCDKIKHGHYSPFDPGNEINFIEIVGKTHCFVVGLPTGYKYGSLVRTKAKKIIFFMNNEP